MHSEEQLIKACQKYKLSAQKELYELYEPVMRLVCLRYTETTEDAEDVLQEGFLKVFQNIKQFKSVGSLEGWIRRIIINTALYHYKKTKRHREQYRFDNINEIDTDVTEEQPIYGFDNSIDRTDVDVQKIDFELIQQADFSQEELLDALTFLKDDFKIVFNLFFIEGFKHKQIADFLGVDEKTSRSRLLRARKQMQQELYRRTISKLVV